MARTCGNEKQRQYISNRSSKQNASSRSMILMNYKKDNIRRIYVKKRNYFVEAKI